MVLSARSMSCTSFSSSLTISSCWPAAFCSALSCLSDDMLCQNVEHGLAIGNEQRPIAHAINFSLRIDAEHIIERRGEIVGTHWVLGREGAGFVRRAVNASPLYAAAG